MHKQIKFKKEVEQAIRKGSQKLAEAVGSTQGPAGKLVILQTKTVYPHITKDGVTVAREMYDIKDPHQRLAVQSIINAANEQVNESGDGTTGTIVIANELIQEGYKAIKRGSNPTKIREGMDKAKDLVVSQLQTNFTRKIDSLDDLKAIATISANNNPEIGELIATAIDKVGEYGAVTQDKSRTNKHDIEYSQGYQWDKGVDSPYFYTDPTKQRSEIINPLILVTDHTIVWVKDIVPLIQKIVEKNEGRELVIIADEVKGEALHSIISNRMEGRFPCTTIQIDGLAERKRQNLEDLAELCGATMISYKKGKLLKDVQYYDLGSCEKIISTGKKTMVINGPGDTTGTIEELSNIINNSEDDVEINDAKERMARINGGVAIIKVGGKTESEQKEIMDRVDDAIRATRSAQEEGLAIGGGSAYVKASNIVKRSQLKPCKPLKDIQTGMDIVLKACEAPFRMILNNANVNPDKRSWFQYSIIQQVQLDMIEGYDALNREPIEDMYKAKIIDPVKVLRTALENAVSVAKVLLTSETMITEGE